MSQSTTARIGLPIVALGLFVVLSWWFGVAQFFLEDYVGDWINRCAFDSQKWIDAEGSVLRNDMVLDLESNHALFGKTEAHVSAVLGKPTEKARGDRYPNAGCDQVWEYRMGSSRHTPDPQTLLVGFRNGKVVFVSQRGT